MFFINMFSNFALYLNYFINSSSISINKHRNNFQLDIKTVHTNCLSYNHKLVFHTWPRQVYPVAFVRLDHRQMHQDDQNCTAPSQLSISQQVSGCGKSCLVICRLPGAADDPYRLVLISPLYACILWTKTIKKKKVDIIYNQN